MCGCLMPEILQRWEDGSFIEEGVKIPEHDYQSLPSEPYEGYMKAYFIEMLDEGKPALLVVEFPPLVREASCLHKHPISDRVITVMKGSGYFIFVRDGKLERRLVTAGTRIWMPRDVAHDFEAGTEGLVVESLHTVWVAISDPQCYVPVKGGME